MIRLVGDRLHLTPSPKHPDKPTHQLPLLSLHTCTCGELVKAYATTDGRLAGFRPYYDPEDAFTYAAIDGGLVVLRHQHGANFGRCATTYAAMNPVDAVEALAAALWHRMHHYDEPPPLPRAINPTAIATLEGVELLDDRLGRRPPVYLLATGEIAERIIPEENYRDYAAWEETARAAFDAFMASVAAPVPAIEVREVVHLPRRRLAPSTEPPPLLRCQRCGVTAETPRRHFALGTIECPAGEDEFRPVPPSERPTTKPSAPPSPPSSTPPQPLDPTPPPARRRAAVQLPLF